MQILACSSTLGTCCSDAGIIMLVNATRKIFDLIQLIVPILLIVFASVELTKMVINPEEKKGLKKVTNKFFAAIIVFFVPVIVNVFMQMMPNSFSVTACWNKSKNAKEISNINTVAYKDPHKGKDKKSLYTKSDEYEPGDEKIEPASDIGVRTNGQVYGSDVAAYAMKFVGREYKRGGRWNGELPYVPTTCIGFIEGIYKHFGITVDWTEDTNKYLKNPSKYTVITNGDIHPGDIVVYDGHYAMLTGNGTQMIHAAGPKYGVILSKDYRKCVKRLLGVVRVNGVM